MKTYTIKPLAWEQDGDDEMHIARTPFGCLRTSKSYFDDTYRARYDCHGSMEWIGYKHESLEAAKQACTERWEGMIRQALEVCDADPAV